jgi:gas vesicle protein
MNALEEFFEIKKIPSTYRYPLALDTMLEFVKNFRASTWKECADKYEEQLHRWQMEANGAESIQLQSEIRNLTESAAKSAKAAAIFSGLNFFLK